MVRLLGGSRERSNGPRWMLRTALISWRSYLPLLLWLVRTYVGNEHLAFNHLGHDALCISNECFTITGKHYVFQNAATMTATHAMANHTPHLKQHQEIVQDSVAKKECAHPVNIIAKIHHGGTLRRMSRLPLPAMLMQDAKYNVKLRRQAIRLSRAGRQESSPDLPAAVATKQGRL